MYKQELKEVEILESVVQATKVFTLSENPVRNKHNIFSELMAQENEKFSRSYLGR